MGVGAETEGYMIFEYRRSFVLPERNADDIIITGRTIQVLRPWIPYFETYGDPERCVCYNKVTRFELLPALLEARANGVLEGPRDVVSMLDEQLLVINTHTEDDARNIGERAAAVLSMLTDGLQIQHLPLTKCRLFPKSLARKRACETCHDDVFAQCYAAISHDSDDISLLTDDVLDWILRSFKWGVTLATKKQDIHSSWTFNSNLFVRTGTNIPMLVDDSTELDVWIMPRGKTLFRVTGLGLPTTSLKLTKCIITNVAQSLCEIFTPAQNEHLCVIDYNMGGDRAYTKCGFTDFRRTHLCEHCAVQPSVYLDIEHYRLEHHHIEDMGSSVDYSHTV